MPAAASGAGFGGAQPPSNRFDSTHSKQRRASNIHYRFQNLSLTWKRPRGSSRWTIIVWLRAISRSCRSSWTPVRN